MSGTARILAVIPARGGSKELPGKNVRPFAGLPLIAHSLLFAKMCPEITQCVVSTDSLEVAEIAKQFGADVPFLRPPVLAQDEAPLWDVLQHTLKTLEQREPQPFDLVLLLDPTSPARESEDLRGALRALQANPNADGIISVSRPSFNPVWHGVVERNGWMKDLFKNGGQYGRRQEAPTVYHINGALYIWRAPFVRTQPSWRNVGKHLIYEIPELRAMSIDTLEQFERAEWLVRTGQIILPWLHTAPSACAPSSS